MGTYYSLVNDTTKESLHLDYHIKASPIMMNRAIHYAFVNYMFEHQGDVFRMISDTGAYNECDDYQEVDLLSYKFNHEEITKEIVANLNIIYANGRYGVNDGVGFEIPKCARDGFFGRVIFSFAKWLVDLGYRLAYYGVRKQ